VNRKTFLKTMCGLGACGCVASVLDPPFAAAGGQADVPDQRLAFARYQVAKLAGFMAASPAVSACTEIVQQTGRECAKLTGLAAKFKGNPEGYFAASREAWGTDFQWDKAKGVVVVTVAGGPCGCPLVDARRTPPFWCNCSLGYQEEMFSAVFGRPAEATLKESKLAGGRHCVFEVRVAPSA